MASARAVGWIGKRRAVLGAFAGSRLLILLVAYLVASFSPMKLDKIGVPVPSRAAGTAWSDPLVVLGSWDAAHYVRLAEFGYRTDTAGEQERFRFFPGWPLAIGALGRMAPFFGYLAWGVIASHIFALAAALRLRSMVARETGSSDLGDKAGMYLLIFPAAYVFSMAYSEGLFLVLSICCLDFLRRRKWWTAALFGFLAALTRAPGFILSLAALIELWNERRTIFSAGRKIVVRLAGPAAAIAGPVVGMLAWLAYTGARTGDPLLVLRFAWEPYFRKGVGLFLVEIVRRLVRLPQTGPNGDIVIAVIVLVTTLVLIFSFRVIPSSLLAFGLVALTFMTTARLLTSWDRYVLALAPVFWALAHFGERRLAWDALYRSAAPVLMGALALGAWTGAWIP